MENLGVGDKCIRPAEGDTCVIFIHGILSHGETAWTNNEGKSWPELLAQEEDLSGIGIYSFSYRSDALSRYYSLGDVVDAIREFFNLRGIWALKRIIFVCHSMGGIAVRRFVVKHQHELIDNHVSTGLFLVASPSLGSEDANALLIFTRLVQNTQAEALRFSQANVWLNDLDRDFLAILQKRRLPIVGKELIEDEPIRIKRWLGFGDQVVQPVSAGRYWGDSFKVPFSDHSSIAKPASRKAIQHELLVLFIKNMLDKETPEALSESVDNLSQSMDSLIKEMTQRLLNEAELKAPERVRQVRAAVRLADKFLRERYGKAPAVIRAEVSQAVDVIEGVCTIDTRTWRTRVPLPPFAATPDITIWRNTGQATSEPQIESATPDQFTLRISGSEQAGEWHWRARGKLRQVARVGR